MKIEMKELDVANEELRVMVGPVLMTVEHVPTLEDADATCEIAEGTIQLREGLDPAWERVCLAHEVLHAVADVHGLEWMNEARVMQLAPLLVELLQRNPQLVTALLGYGTRGVLTSREPLTEEQAEELKRVWVERYGSHDC